MDLLNFDTLKQKWTIQNQEWWIMLTGCKEVSQIKSKVLQNALLLSCIKKTRSVTMNIFSKKIFFFKSFVKNRMKLYFHNKYSQYS